MSTAKSLAGEVGAEADDPLLAHPHPLAVRPGQADHRLLGERLHRAEDLRLLAAHHFAHARRVEARHARDDERRRPLQFDRLEARRDLRRAGGALAVRHLDPALAAADHAAEDDDLAAAGEPTADLAAKHLRKLPCSHQGDAARGFAPRENRAGLVEAVGAEAGRSPVDGDHRQRLVVAGGAHYTRRATPEVSQCPTTRNRSSAPASGSAAKTATASSTAAGSRTAASRTTSSTAGR